MFRLAVLICCLASFAYGAPARYTLDAAQSEVTFSYTFEGVEKQGEMPVQSADMLIDLDNLSASQVDVSLNAHGARAGFVFATKALKSPQVLDTQAHPIIRFQSSQFKGDLNGATVTGTLTVRGVTRPVTLKAELFRQRGTDLGDRSKLTVLLIGSIDRRDFGAVGFPGFVGPHIGLRIMARITQ